jgi:hypothetical protein
LPRRLVSFFIADIGQPERYVDPYSAAGDERVNTYTVADNCDVAIAIGCYAVDCFDGLLRARAALWPLSALTQKVFVRIVLYVR